MRTSAACAALVLAAGAATAGPTVRITQICGGGAITNFVPTAQVLSPTWTLNNIDSLHVNNAGHWYVEVASGGTPNRSMGVVNFGSGPTVQNEHWALNIPADATIDPGHANWCQRGLHAADLNNLDGVVRTSRITNVSTPTGTVDPTGNVGTIRFNNTQMLVNGGFLNGNTNFVDGQAVGAPASATLPGAIWGTGGATQWQDDCPMQINDSNQVLMICTYRPDPSTLTGKGLFLFQLDAAGAITSTTLLKRLGDPSPGGLGVVAGLIGNPGTANGRSIHDLALNNAGQYIYSLLDDGFVSYVMVGNTIVAQSNGPSPVAGVNYGTLDGVPCDINSSGDWVIRAPLADGTAAIIKSIAGVQSVVARAGGSAPDMLLPDISASPITVLECGKANGAVKIDDAGRVLWWGRFNTPASNCALFRDDQVLVRQGVTYRTNSTLIGAGTATDGTTTTQLGLDFDADQFDMSDNGRWVIFKMNSTSGAATLTANLMEVCPGADVACNAAIGACCQTGGCTVVSAADCATAGGTYAGNFAPCSACPPANDDCEHAIDLTGAALPALYTIANASATSSVIDPGLCNTGTLGNYDVWFKYAATSSTTLGVIESSTQAVVYAVWAFPTATATCPTISDSPTIACTTAQGLQIPVAPGTTYYIQVSQGGTATPTVALSLSFNTPPPNDDCPGAINLTSATFPVRHVINNSAAGSGAVDPGTCNTGALANFDVWFRYDATTNVSLVASEVSGQAVVFAAWAFPTGSAACPTTSDVPVLACTTSQAPVMALTAGNTYFIQISQGGTATPTAAIDVTFSLLTNDECSGTLPVVTRGVVLNGSTVGATTSFTVAPSTLCGTSGTNSGGISDVFTRFVAPATTTYVAALCGSSYDTVLSIHSDCPATSANVLACNDDSTGQTGACATANNSRIPTVALTAGQTYFIRVGGFSGTGNFSLLIDYTNPAAVGSCCVESACTQADSGNCTGTFTAGQSCTPNPCAVAGVCCRGATCNATIGSAGCVASGAAGAFFSPAAACNAGGNANSPCCYADYNKMGGRNVSDIFAFLTDWFAGSPRALFGGDGTSGLPSVSHIFQFLTAWFSGTC